MKTLCITLAVMLTCATLLLVQPADSVAQSSVGRIEGVDYNVDASMVENLKALVGKKVNVALTSGSEMSGTVKAVGNHMLHLEKLNRKEFFDALIPIENIAALDTRMRKKK